jgi:hypothetical protein
VAVAASVGVSEDQHRQDGVDDDRDQKLAERPGVEALTMVSMIARTDGASTL